MTEKGKKHEAVSEGAVKAVITNYNHKCKDKTCKDLHSEVNHDFRS